jgi:uncharacterized integral membrane protein
MVPDDDFDIDVEELAGEELEPAAACPAPPAVAVPAPEAGGGARTMSARKPGTMHQLGDKLAAPFTRVRMPEWNLQTFGYLLVILILLWFLLENLAPVRVRLLVWNGEAPKTLLFLVNLALGAVLLLGWQRWSAARQSRRDAAAPPK